MEKAILVGLDLPTNLYDIQYSLEELKNLALSNEIEVVEIISQKLKHPTSNLYVGKGKVEEIKQAVLFYEATIVIFDDELSPSQLFNLEKHLEVKIIDRSFLILDIFAKRAKTTESILEVKLAQNKYLLPRLHGLHEDLSRQGGTSGSFSAKGPGEKQLELDRRLILGEINRCQSQLEQIRKMKVSQAKRRKEDDNFIVCLVGYTNAGKSSTMNTILNYTSVEEAKTVYEKDKLFATLQTFTRKVNYNKTSFLLVDTIGFVSKLPHHLVNSFLSTLEEIKHADLLLHVVDISSKYCNEQIDVTNTVLESLGCSNIDTVYLLNKYDLYDENANISGAKAIPFSNKTKLNLDNLLDLITTKVNDTLLTLDLQIPYELGNIINFVEENTNIQYKLYSDKFVNYSVKVNKKHYSKLAIYETNNLVN